MSEQVFFFSFQKQTICTNDFNKQSLVQKWHTTTRYYSSYTKIDV